MKGAGRKVMEESGNDKNERGRIGGREGEERSGEEREKSTRIGSPGR